MKLLSSSFSSSSSTISTTTSFDSKSSTASCLAGILRRILCSGTLPTYPSDHITEETNSLKRFRDFRANEKTPGSSDRETNPGLVARLMGLESMPETNFRGSIYRSRSVNSADRSKEDDPNEVNNRRVKSTASFREIPTFLELQDKEFFILSFENESDRREFRPKGGKSETGFGELKQRRKVKGKREETTKAKATEKEDRQGTRKVLSDLNGKETVRRRDSIDHKLTNSNKVKDEKNPWRKHAFGSETAKSRVPKNPDSVLNSNAMKPSLKKKIKKAKPELNSEDSSPVSVLDCGQFLVDPKDTISEADCSSRRKLSLETKDDCERQSPRRDDDLIDKERKTETKQGNKESASPEKSNVLAKICRLSEAELMGASWVRKWTLDHEDLQNIGEETEALILGQLLEELVDQFQ